MTEERRLKLEAQLDEALATGDGARVEAVRRTIDRETLECTAHTADRIKRIERRTECIEEKVDEIAVGLKSAKDRMAGAKMLLDALKILVGAGGGAALIKVLGG